MQPGSVPASDIYSWEQIQDESAVQSTIKAVARLLPLDLHALAEEAREMMYRLDMNLFDSIFTFLPAVDIDPPTWENAAVINRDDVTRGLLHPSAWINYLAANICASLPMTRDELGVLLCAAKGNSLRYIILLIQCHHFDELSQMLLQRLSNDASGDVSRIFEVLRELATPPSTELMNTTLACLCSSDENTVESATELLCHWIDQGIAIDEESVAKAVEHWGGPNSGKRNSLMNTPVFSLNGLLDRIKACQ